MIRGLFVIMFAILGLAPTSLAQDLRDAVRTGNVERVKALLDSGADANTSYENGFTPIYFADHPGVVDLLLAHGAKLDIRDAASIRSPLESAAENHFRDAANRDRWQIIVGKLRAAGAAYTIDTAIYLNDVAFVAKKLAADASWVNNRAGSQSVPLRLAARTGRVEICKLLLEHKADPNSFEEGNGFPILVDAVKHAAIVRLLIDHGADLKRGITWRGGRSGIWIIGDEATALHYAVEAGNLESVELLIAAGLDPNAADEQGQTALHIAVRFERFEKLSERDASSFVKIIAYLIEKDAATRVTDKSGKTPLKWARELKSPKEIRQILRKELP